MNNLLGGFCKSLKSHAQLCRNRTHKHSHTLFGTIRVLKSAAHPLWRKKKGKTDSLANISKQLIFPLCLKVRCSNSGMDQHLLANSHILIFTFCDHSVSTAAHLLLVRICISLALQVTYWFLKVLLFDMAAFNIKYDTVKWWVGNRNIHIFSWTDSISLLARLRVCATSCACCSIGRLDQTPVQSVFNFPEIKLHGRAITSALDCTQVILEIINRPLSVWMCKCIQSVCADASPCALHVCVCVCDIHPALSQIANDIRRKLNWETNIKNGFWATNQSCKNLLTVSCKLLTAPWPFN